MSTQQMSLVTVSVDGETLGVWDTLDEGETSAEPTKHRPGGMGVERSYAALPTHADVTAGRVFERERDAQGLAARLRTRTGRARVVAAEQPLDDDGVAFGKPTIRTGRLMSVNTGAVDSTSSELRMITLGIQVTEIS